MLTTAWTRQPGRFPLSRMILPFLAATFAAWAETPDDAAACAEGPASAAWAAARDSEGRARPAAVRTPGAARPRRPGAVAVLSSVSLLGGRAGRAGPGGGGVDPPTAGSIHQAMLIWVLRRYGMVSRRFPLGMFLQVNVFFFQFSRTSPVQMILPLWRMSQAYRVALLPLLSTVTRIVCFFGLVLPSTQLAGPLVHFFDTLAACAGAAAPNATPALRATARNPSAALCLDMGNSLRWYGGMTPGILLERARPVL